MKVSDNTEDRVRDVVCGMTIAREQAAGSSTVGGTDYYFCSLPCKGRFDADPGRYVDHPS